MWQVSKVNLWIPFLSYGVDTALCPDVKYLYMIINKASKCSGVLFYV